MRNRDGEIECGALLRRGRSPTVGRGEEICHVGRANRQHDGRLSSQNTDESEIIWGFTIYLPPMAILSRTGHSFDYKKVAMSNRKMN
jgi:hypothetical protein